MSFLLQPSLPPNFRPSASRPAPGTIRDLLSAARTTLFGTLAFVLVAPAVHAASDEEAKPLTVDDFAIGRPLVGEPGRLLQSVLLDYSVYRESVEPRLADLRVFDADGRPTPYAIRRNLARSDSKEELADLPLFALDAPALRSASEGSESEATGSAEDYRIEARVSDSGAIVSVERGNPSDAQSAGAWLLDASAIRDQIIGLHFDVAPQDGDHLVRVRVESSGDLSRWQPVDSEIVLARLLQGGHRIERSKFTIPSSRARYYRITPTGDPQSIELTRVQARVRKGASPPPPRKRQRLEGRSVDDRPGAFEFDLAHLPPIDRVRVDLPELGSIVEARLESARTPEGPWRRRWSGLLYAIDRKGPVRNPSISWQADGDRWIRLVTSRNGGGLRGAPPALEVEWLAEQLIYVDRGDGESMLAVGRLDADDESFEVTPLMKLTGVRASAFPHETARLGPARVLAGDAATRRIEAVPWRTYGLWAFLLVSVALVLGMSMRLLRAP